MDKDTRSLLQRATQAARRTLEEEFAAQLEGVFDIRPDGTVAAEAGRHLAEDGEAQRVRVKLVAAVQHHREQGRRPADAVAAVLRECAFTTLNRFVALKMLEAREIVKPCVSQGQLSGGFKEFTGLAPGLATLPDQGYRLYLDSLFDEIGREVKVLFDRRDPASLLWPRKAALDALLGILNDADLAGVWGEDETIGWVYQYFNADDERKQMRAQSQVPRTSRELAVRNQFFTPRYVVEFLTDNTLARMWSEMRRGDTRLATDRRFLVRRSREEFLRPGEDAPLVDESIPVQERPIYVPFRSKKDPRDLRVLDPACGSGHFLLYSFDVLLVIFEEGWSDPDSPRSVATGNRLSDDYASLDALRRAVPGLVLRHNLYGVDIDPRAAQIASLALWMRAQRAWNEFGVTRLGRPLVTRTNVVVAEAMPGEADLLNELCEGLDRGVGDIVRAVFEEMTLAGEAGMLLRIDQTVRQGLDKIANRGTLFSEDDGERWRNVEQQVYAALRRYAEAAGLGYRKRLFAEDAAQGFAFIEACRQQYDVVLMNPPFGDATERLATRLSTCFPTWGGNLASAFVARARLAALPQGFTGAIIDTAIAIRSSYEDFRRQEFFDAGQLEAMASLGWGVLDANVETSAVVRAMTFDSQATFWGGDLRNCLPENRPELLMDCCQLRAGTPVARVATAAAAKLPNAVIDPGWPQFLVELFRSNNNFTDIGIPSFQGHALQAARHYRMYWELPLDTDLSGSGRWVFAFKGGEYSPGYLPESWVALIGQDYQEVPDSTANVLRNRPRHFLGGVGYGKRGQFVDAQPLRPSGIFTHEGMAFVPESESERWMVLAIINSDLFNYGINLYCGQHKTTGYVNLFPVPNNRSDIAANLSQAAMRRLATSRARWWRTIETDYFFDGPLLLWPTSGTISERMARIDDMLLAESEALRGSWREMNDAIFDAYEVSPRDRDIVRRYCESRPPLETRPWRYGIEASNRHKCAAEDAISYLVGCVLGRFDMREETGLRAPSEPPGPFDPITATSRRRDPHGQRGGVVAIDGVLVDDVGSASDLLSRLESAFTVVFRDVGGEGLQALFDLAQPGIFDLRSWIRSRLFDIHIAEYSSGRAAPIYWRIGTPSGSYSVWLYLHRMGPDTLHAVLRDHVEPKLRYEEERWHRLSADAGALPSTSQRKELAAQETFVEELRAFRDEMLRVAPLWKPVLDDGVVINASFLHRLFLHTKSWAKECEGHWEKLKAGEYDWAHLAMRLWPERVVAKCAVDRSLAIAHGVEDVFWVEGEDGKWLSRELDEATFERLVSERTSAAVKAALREMSAAPPPARVARALRPPPVAKAPRERAPAQPAAQLPLDLGGARPRANRSALDALRAALHGFPDGAGKSELLAASGLDEGQWMPAITELVESGEVERTGQKRGTRYTLRAGGRS
jgi:hypothetical protein